MNFKKHEEDIKFKMNSKMNLSRHKEFMRIALELAVHGNPTPNPYVGCVIVKEGKIISQGYHKRCGEAHAEVDALDKIKKSDWHRLEVSTFYITLEPCTHYGRTPPCVDEIINSKPKEVIIAVFNFRRLKPTAAFAAFPPICCSKF